jgi:hypothetical protein
VARNIMPAPFSATMMGIGVARRDRRKDPRVVIIAVSTALILLSQALGRRS